MDITEAFHRKKVKEKKDRVLDLFVLAEVTANRIVIGFNSNASDSDLAQPWHYYPSLFEDKTDEIEEQRELRETEMLKTQLNARVAAWNKRFEEEHKNGSGKTDDKSNGGDDGRPDEAEKA